MRPIEFFQANSTLFVTSPDNTISELTEADTDLIDYLYDRIATDYPWAYCALVDEFSRCRKNVRYFRFRIVDRFLRCNFGKCDNLADIDASGEMHLEFVDCPLRGQCRHERVVCLPRRQTELSPAEMRVGALLFNGFSRQAIADRLYLSPFTVDNHIRHIYAKLGVHTEADFVRAANLKHLFANYEIQ